MEHQEINICGKQVIIGYCYATEIVFKDITDRDITDFMQEVVTAIKDNRMPDIKNTIFTIIAAILAYYNSRQEEPPVKDTDLMNEASPIELGNALGTILQLRADFYHIPTGEPAGKSMSDGSSPRERKGHKKN